VAGKTVFDALGAYGRSYEYDDRGLVTRIRNLNALGNTLVEKTGVAGHRRSYNALGDLASVDWLEVNNRLIANGQHFSHVLLARDNVGNVHSEDYQDEAGSPVDRTDRGISRVRERCDQRGNLVEEAYFSVTGKPIIEKGTGVARVTWRYDNAGNQIEEAYYDLDGQATLAYDSGFARMTRSYDDRGNVIEEAYSALTANRCLLRARASQS